MRLVNDQRVVGQQQWIGLRFGQQNAVCHQLDRCVARELVLESHFVANHLAKRRFQLLSNAFSYRGSGDAPGLGVADDLAAFGFG